MEFIRVILSIALFIGGGYFIYDLFVNGFELLILLLVPTSFYGAYLIWPRNSDDHEYLNFIGEIIEFPVRAVIAIAKMVTGVIRLAGD